MDDFFRHFFHGQVRFPIGGNLFHHLIGTQAHQPFAIRFRQVDSTFGHYGYFGFAPQGSLSMSTPSMSNTTASIFVILLSIFHNTGPGSFLRCYQP